MGCDKDDVTDDGGTIKKHEKRVRRCMFELLLSDPDPHDLHDIAARKKLYKPLTTLADGSCMFDAMSHGLRHLGRGERTHVDIRRETVAYLRCHRETRDGIDRKSFIDPEHYAADYDAFVNEIAKPTTYGEYTCLHAMHELYSVTIRVLNEDGHETVIQGPDNWPTVYLGLANEHYHVYFPLPDCPSDDSQIAATPSGESSSKQTDTPSAGLSSTPPGESSSTPSAESSTTPSGESSSKQTDTPSAESPSTPPGESTVRQEQHNYQLPGFGAYSSWIFTILQFYTTLLERSQLELFDKASNQLFRGQLRHLVAVLKKMKQALISFHTLFPDCKTLRETTLIDLKKLNGNLQYLHDTQRNVDITKVTSASVGVLSGAATITGIALAPFTFGVSLGLTIGGLSFGLASTATGIGATGVKIKRERDIKKQFEEKRKNDVIKFGELKQCLDEIQELDETIKELVKVIQADQVALNLFCNIGDCNMAENGKHVTTVMRSIKALGLLHLDDVAAQVAVGAGKMASRVAGIVFSGVGIAFDVAEIAISSRSIDTGSVNATAAELAATIVLMQDQLEQVTELHEHIKITAAAALDEDINALQLLESVDAGVRACDDTVTVDANDVIPLLRCD